MHLEQQPTELRSLTQVERLAITPKVRLEARMLTVNLRYTLCPKLGSVSEITHHRVSFDIHLVLTYGAINSHVFGLIDCCI